MLPSKFENIFLTFEIFSFFTIAAIDGPFPETEAPNAPLSIKSTIILGSEFSIEDVANPFIVIASQYFFSLANSHALLKIDEVAKKLNKPLGFHVIDSDHQKILEKINKGYSFLAFSLDFFFLGDKAREEMKLLKSKLQ